MIKRELEKEILKLSKKYPVIAITGPRQSGKTTLAKALFRNHEYYNLEEIDVLEYAKNDPRAFLQTGSKKKLIIDEIQKAPELLSYIQAEVDLNKKMGQFVITGSQHFTMNEKITQSLAGRVANFTLLPFSYKEISKYHTKTNNLQFLIKGFYPGIYDRKIASKDFYKQYIFSYIERDVRQVVNVGDLTNFQRFLLLLANRVGQQVNLTSLGNDVGVSHKTISSWISILEQSFILYNLRPYYENFGKRVTKSPKIFFYDTGLLCYLLEINSLKTFKFHHLTGNIFENFVISEIQKNLNNLNLPTKLYYWNENNKNEVDLIIDKGQKKDAIEIKIAQTFTSSFLTGITRFTEVAKKYNITGKVIFTGKSTKTKNIEILNWEEYLKPKK